MTDTQTDAEVWKAVPEYEGLEEALIAFDENTATVGQYIKIREAARRYSELARQKV